MKNKVELKKFLLKVLGVTLVLLVVFLIVNVYEYQRYTKNFNNVINGIVNSLAKEYPDLTEKEIVKVLNSKGSKRSFILEKYGISLNNKSVVLENERLKYRFLVLNMVLLILGIMVFMILFMRYLKKRDKNINEITRYIQELNKRNYSLKIDSNSEDEDSILKNEIYKTTVMLREAADNSKRDKLNLKVSLEDISHQLKTPLTSILVMLDDLIDDLEMDKETREDFVRDIKRNVVNINFLVQSILKLSKFDANTIDFVKEERLVKDIVDEAIKNVSILCDLKNIRINIEGDEEIKLNCDFRWQVEALTNIVKNSIEHSPINSKIDIFYERNKAYLTVMIKDYGEGIDEEDMAYIFERFYQGKKTYSDNMGIGLALAKRIIENDKGIINVVSNNEGTKFIIKYFYF